MKLIDIFILAILFILLIITLGISLWKYDEVRCYNMPLNKVYKDKLCQLHTQTFEEINNK